MLKPPAVLYIQHKGSKLLISPAYKSLLTVPAHVSIRTFDLIALLKFSLHFAVEPPSESLM